MVKKRNKYELIHFMHQGKPLLREINTDIELVTVNLEFINDFESYYKKYCIDLKPFDKAVCTPDCINKDCTKGFFDLSNEIYFVLRDKKIKSSGKINCDGWQDLERTGNHICGTTLNYEITAIYNK